MSERREYTAGRPTTLTAALSIGATAFTIADATNWPTSTEYDFWVTVDGGTAQEERILCSARTGTSVTIRTRGADGTTESNHSAGATIWPSWSATDADEANAHVNAVTNIHGISGAIAPLASPTFTGTVTLPSTTSIGNVSSTEIGYLDGITSAVQTQINTNTPVGAIIMYGGTTNPTGWLLCNGQSTTGYPALAALIGSTVPDLRGRAPIGYGTSADTTNVPTARTTIGAVTGKETHTLSVGEMPSHNHPYDAGDGAGSVAKTHFMDRNASHSHGDNLGNGYSRSYGATYGGDGSHGHGLIMHFSGTASHDHAIAGASNPLPAMQSDGGSAGTIGNYNGTAIQGGGSHQHSTYIDMYYSDVNHRHTIQAQGGGAEHNNMQPSTVVNFIIKT